MTQDEREELARAMARANGDNPDAMTPTNGGGENAIWQDFAEYADAIAPIIERLVAERVAAETERCAKVAFAENDCGGMDVCRSTRLKDGSCILSMSGECRRDNSEEVAAAIRSATR